MTQRDEIISPNRRATAGPRDKQELRYYLIEDLQAHGLASWRWYDRFRFPIVHFQIALRKTELAINTQKGLFGRLYAASLRYRLQHLGVKLGFTIPPNVFGHGLSIAHWGTIVVNEDCRVGSHCRIHPGSCLGWHNGRVPMLGNYCYIGPGAKLFGDVVLGDNTRIGANSVVNKSFPDGNVTLVGSPAKPTRESTGCELADRKQHGQRSHK